MSEAGLGSARNANDTILLATSSRVFRYSILQASAHILVIRFASGRVIYSRLCLYPQYIYISYKIGYPCHAEAIM